MVDSERVMSITRRIQSFLFPGSKVPRPGPAPLGTALSLLARPTSNNSTTYEIVATNVSANDLYDVRVELSDLLNPGGLGLDDTYAKDKPTLPGPLLIDELRRQESHTFKREAWVPPSARRATGKYKVIAYTRSPSRTSPVECFAYEVRFEP
jgi:hypothetical protein